MAQATPHVVPGDGDTPDCELLGRAAPPKVRAPTYLVRLLLGTIALLIGLLIAVFYEDAVAGLAYNQRLLLDAFPDVLVTLATSLGVYALGALVLATNARLVTQRRLRTALTLDLAAGVGALASFGAGSQALLQEQFEQIKNYERAIEDGHARLEDLMMKDLALALAPSIAS